MYGGRERLCVNVGGWWCGTWNNVGTVESVMLVCKCPSMKVQFMLNGSTPYMHDVQPHELFMCCTDDPPMDPATSEIHNMYVMHLYLYSYLWIYGE